MRKEIEIIQKIAKNPDEVWTETLRENDLYKIFSPIYRLNLTITEQNLLVCFVVYSCDPDSPKLDIRKDRLENKRAILNSISEKLTKPIFEDIINNANDEYNDVVISYLEKLLDWRWQQIFSFMDYHATMMRFANKKTDSEKTIDQIIEGKIETLTEEIDMDKVAKINKQKGELLNMALEAREKAEKLLSEIKKDFVATDTAIQADLGFTFTDTAKERIDILSWRGFIRNRIIPAKQA